MSLRELAGPNSLNQIVYVILLWIIIILGLSYFYDTPLVRLEIIVATGLVMIWAVWAIRYRFEQVQRDRYKR